VRIDFWNSSTKAYYGYATFTANDTNPTTKIDAYCDLGGATARTTQTVNYTPGATNTFESHVGGDTSSVITKLPTETVNGSINITINCTAFYLDDVMFAIRQFVRNPIAEGDYQFYAEGVAETVSIIRKIAECDLAIVQNNGWWEFKYGPVYDIPNFQPADHWLAYGTGAGTPLVGDFNDDDIDDIGIRYNNGWWEFKYGPVDDIPNYSAANHWLAYGTGAGTPIVGDFNDDNIDDIGIRYNNGWWEFKYGPVDDILNFQPADHWLAYGTGAGTPLVGDFENDGIDGIGIHYDDGWWEFKYGPVDDILNFQPADHWLAYGIGTGTPLVGDFENDGIDGIGINHNDGWWEFKSGPVDEIPNFQPSYHWLAYGTGAGTPIVGSFNP
jgi:hypothetical protein